MATPYDAFRPELLTQGITSGINSIVSGYLQANEKKQEILKQGKVAKSFLDLYAKDDPNTKEFLKKKPEENDFEYSQRVASQAEGLMMNMAAQKQQQALQSQQMELQRQQQEQARQAKVLQQYAAADTLSQGKGQGVYNPAMKAQANQIAQSPIGAKALDIFRFTGNAPSEGMVANLITTEMANNRRPEQGLDAAIDPGTGVMFSRRTGEVLKNFTPRPAKNVAAEADAANRSKMAGESLTTLQEGANRAQQNIALANRAEKLLDEGLQTGGLASFRNKAARFFSIPLEQAAKEDEFNRASGTFWINVFQEGLKGGGALSNVEGARLEKIVPSMVSTPDGNRALLAHVRALANRNATIAKKATELRSKMDDFSAFQELRNFESSLPPFIPSDSAVAAFREDYKKNPAQAIKDWEADFGKGSATYYLNHY